MNEFFQQWLDARSSVPGMIACAVTGNDHDACRSQDASFPAEQMREVVRALRTGAPLPGAHPSEVRWHTWAFANGKIRSVTRPDGWIFTTAVRANSEAAQILDPLSEEFLALKPPE
ncbi:MAG TPA: hypothetical protein VGN23_06985 [Verrucomicrobiae bacterium]|jgi:hypothetical protein